MKTFPLDGHEVDVEVAEGWFAHEADGRIMLRRNLSSGLPPATLTLALAAGEDARDVLDAQLRGCVEILTDFTVLHLEARPSAPENWSADPPVLPFVFGGCRQGAYSLAVEFGIVGSDGSDYLIASTGSVFEEAAALRQDFDQMLDAIRVRW